MNQKVHRIGAAAVLVISFGMYLKTVALTVSFWDCGEFIACSYILGVPHPPGAPLYLLLGRLFTFLPIGEDPAFPVNLMSVISSALAVMFVYLITVRLILLARGGDQDGEETGFWRHLPVVVGGATAALRLTLISSPVAVLTNEGPSTSNVTGWLLPVSMMDSGLQAVTDAPTSGPQTSSRRGFAA